LAHQFYYAVFPLTRKFSVARKKQATELRLSRL
jgi:hypothetical protein